MKFKDWTHKDFELCDECIINKGIVVHQAVLFDDKDGLTYFEIYFDSFSSISAYENETASYSLDLESFQQNNNPPLVIIRPTINNDDDFDKNEFIFIGTLKEAQADERFANLEFVGNVRCDYMPYRWATNSEYERYLSKVFNQALLDEMQGIYDVTFRDKKHTPIKTDLEFIEDAIIREVIMYVKGYQDERRDKGMGAEHIKIHLDENSEGQITLEELLNLGNSIRAYLKIFKEPFIDTANAKIYEWENENSVRFRAVVDKQRGGLQLPLSPFTNQIITFYSDRNLKDKMEFKNPQVEQYYKTNKSHTRRQQ